MDDIKDIVNVVFGVLAALLFYAVAGVSVLLAVTNLSQARQLRRMGESVPPLEFSLRSVGSGVLALAMGAVLMASILDVESRPLWVNIAYAVPVAGITLSWAWLIVFGYTLNPVPETMAHFDHFGRIGRKAFEGANGPLTLAARVLHRNTDRLKGEFTVITTTGDDPEAFPRGRDALYPYWVALVSNREPIGLFFCGKPDPRTTGLYVEERLYELCRLKDCILPGHAENPWRRRHRVHTRLSTRHDGEARLSEENVQRLIDDFVEKHLWPLPPVLPLPFESDKERELGGTR